MKSCGHLPLVSPLLYRLEVRHIALRIPSGNVPAVRELAAVFCTSPDAKARHIAGEGIRHLKTTEQVEMLCHESLLRDHDGLLALACECRYLPAVPAEQALWLFCTSHTEELRRLDPDASCPLLAAGYYGASAPVRARARSTARTNGSCSMLARALTGAKITRNAGCWSYDEWDLVITALISGQKWDDLWLLAALVPIPLAVTAIAALRGAGWAPAGDDLLLWNRIVSALPDRWTHPVPAGLVVIPATRPAAPAVRLTFSPDGSLFATGYRDGMIAVRRTASAGPVAELSAGPGSVRYLAISPENTLLVYGGDDGAVHGYGLQDRARLWSREDRRGATALSLSPENRSVSVGDEAGSLHVSDTRDGRLLNSLQAHPSPVTCLAHAPGGSPVACGHADGTVSVIHDGENSSPQLFSGNGSPACSLTFSPAGTELLALYEQGNPALLDITAGKKTITFTGHAGRTSCSAVSAEGGWFAIGSDDHTLRCWSWRGPAPATVLPLYNRHITCCSTVPDGRLLATGFHDGMTRIWRMPGAQLLRECRGDKKTITSCALTPDGTRLATVSWDGTARLWRLPQGEIVRTLDAHAGGIISLTGPAGNLIATATGDGIARIFDGSDGSLVNTIDLYTPAVRAAAMSPDGTCLASAGADASLRLWRIRDGSLIAAGDPLATSQRCCTFLPDGSSLVTGGWDGACRFFRVPDLKLLRTLFGHTSTVTCCTVSRDGTLLVTGSNDTTVRLWDTQEEEAYAVLGESRSEVSAVALSPDETLLAAGSADGIVRLYRLPYGTPAGDLPGMPWKVTALAFTRDGCTLIAGFDRGVCALFSLPGKSLIRTIPCHTGAVTGIAVFPCGRTLVTTGGDGVCRFHPLPFAPFLVHAGLADIPAAVSEEASAGGSPDCAPWTFLHTLLAARFRGEIQICPPLDMAGCYDIQIVG
jgi:WD40 repeat protein